MKWFVYTILLLGTVLRIMPAKAQQSLVEGVIVYHVSLMSPENVALKGSFTYSFKNDAIRKEMELDNGYSNIYLINCRRKEVYSLQTLNGQKYAIELDMHMLNELQQQYAGYVIDSEASSGSTLAGCKEMKGILKDKKGGRSEISYTRDWKPAKSVAFPRFPDATFLPLRFSYNRRNGVRMYFDAAKVVAGPVPSSIFRIPEDYKIISLDEYKQLSK